MLVVNKDGTKAYNLNYIINIYTTPEMDGYAIKAGLADSYEEVTLAAYKSREENRMAFDMLLDDIRRADFEVISMPTDATVSRLLREDVEKLRK